MSSVIADLERWGPEVMPQSVDLASAQQYTWKLATSHYENFPVISWAVPKPLRQHFANVYAFCRWGDDLGDETGSTERSLKLLEWWQEELEKCFRGNTQHPVYVALESTIEQFSIPMEPFADLISAFVQDQTVTEYETFEQLIDYCQRSANPVGRIVLHLANRASAEAFLLSDSICTGLQLANFWQDVARDKEIGRVYLPREDRERFHYSNEDLDARKTTDTFRELIAFEVDRTRQMLLAGKPIVAAMPGRLKIDIDLFLRGGLLVLDGIEKIDCDVWNQRPIVHKKQLFSAALRSLLSVFLSRNSDR